MCGKTCIAIVVALLSIICALVYVSKADVDLTTYVVSTLSCLYIRDVYPANVEDLEDVQSWRNILTGNNGETVPPLDDDLTLITDILSDPGGTLLYRICRPREISQSASKYPILLWFHGGGFVLGSAASLPEDALVRQLCKELKVIVVSVEYRLAPEYLFPSAHQDAGAAVVWVAEHAEEFGGDAMRILIAGESAGGTLAISAGALQNELRNCRIVGVISAYPMIEPRLSHVDSHRKYANYNCLLTTKQVYHFCRTYLPPVVYERPCHLHDEWSKHCLLNMPESLISRMPPLLLILAQHDVLRDEGLLFAKILEDRKKQVQTIIVDSFHGFLLKFKHPDQLKIIETMRKFTE